jgi:hypothetical protein
MLRACLFCCAPYDEGKRIAREENRAYAAGQAVRRTLNKLRGDR